MKHGRPRWIQHLPEYAAEAFGLGLFMVSACGFALLFFHPASPALQWLPGALGRNLAMGAAMAVTLLVNVYGPWGQRSGAHLNPAVTLTFYRLGKVAAGDVPGYIAAQFIGGLAGTGVAVLIFGSRLADPSVNYVATVPGPGGVVVAFFAELTITFVLMLVILHVASSAALSRYTGVFAAVLVGLYIAFEAPYSGMSMNPARTVGSAVYAHLWTGLWLYFVAPPLGMLAAAEVFLRLRGTRARLCAKLYHSSRVRCIFCGQEPVPQPAVDHREP
jgi:aquaporin Z